MNEGGGNGGGGGGGGGGAQPIPYETYQATVTAKNAADAEVARLKGELQKATERGATVDVLTTQLNEWKGKAEAATNRFAVFTELSGALGTTDTDVIESFESKYGALPEKDRPARKAWVESLKAKPEEAPAILRPWLAGGGNGGGAGKVQPKVVGSGTQTPGAPGQPTADEVRKARDEAVRTGNWAAWKDVRKRLGLEK
jgi:hypothetical protein